MRSAKAKILLVLWMFVLTAGVGVVWFLSDMAIKKNASDIQKESSNVMDKVNKVSSKVNKMEESVGEVSARLSGQVDNFNSLQEKITLNAQEKEEVMNAVSAMKGDIAKFQQEYLLKLGSLQVELKALRSKIDDAAKNVNLGTISVVKEPAPEVAAPVAASNASVSANVAVPVDAKK